MNNPNYDITYTQVGSTVNWTATPKSAPPVQMFSAMRMMSFSEPEPEAEPEAASFSTLAEEGDFSTLADEQDLDIVFTITDHDTGGTITHTVSVPVGENGDPTAGPPIVGNPDPATGVVEFEIDADDPDGDPLHQSLGTPPQHGEAVYNDATNTWTYTPFATDRHDAAALGADAATTSDSFTVVVDDGNGGTIEVPVSVNLTPKLDLAVRAVTPVSHDVTGGIFTTSHDGRYIDDMAGTDKLQVIDASDH